MRAPFTKYILNYKLQGFFLLLVITTLCIEAAYAVQPRSGYFSDVDLQPIGTADITIAETEPAVVLVFAVDQKTADITRQFDEWYNNSLSLPEVNVFAVAVNTANMSNDIVLEAINQRNLSVPVFLASEDMLHGDDFRLFVLDGGLAVERFSSFDVPVINAALARLGIPTPEFGLPGTAPAATPAPTPDTTSSVVPPAESMTTTTTTVAVTDAEPTSQVAGGEMEDNIYVNDNYGFTVEFPPGWKYQIAAKEDGAVAIEPTGSEMDMRVWSIPAEEATSPQDYVDQRLESLARKQTTRVNVERRFEVREDGRQGLDVTYNYAKPIDANIPARGLLLYRGRIQVFLDDGQIKAASVEAPAGEFTAMIRMIDSFFRSFEVQPAAYSSPVL